VTTVRVMIADWWIQCRLVRLVIE